jgi:hypothetical protein
VRMSTNTRRPRPRVTILGRLGWSPAGGH